MYKVYYVFKGKIYCDYGICDTEQEALDGFNMSHANDNVLLINIEREG